MLVCWRLGQVGRNLRHLILLLDELQALGVGFITLGEGIDTTTPAGRLQLHVLSAISQFERIASRSPGVYRVTLISMLSAILVTSRRPARRAAIG